MSETDAHGAFSILMVCTGNIGRSPMMERLMKHELARHSAPPQVHVSSAGTWGQEGQPMEPGASHALTALGVHAASFGATPLTADAVVASDLILVATRDHRRDVVGLVPSAVRRAFTMRELARIAQFVVPRDVPRNSPAESVEQMREAVAWAAQLRGSVPRPDRDDDDDLSDPLGASDAIYTERAEVIAASVERIVPYLLGESQAG